MDGPPFRIGVVGLLVKCPCTLQDRRAYPRAGRALVRIHNAIGPKADSTSTASLATRHMSNTSLATADATHGIATSSDAFA